MKLGKILLFNSALCGDYFSSHWRCSNCVKYPNQKTAGFLWCHATLEQHPYFEQAEKLLKIKKISSQFQHKNCCNSNR